MPSMGLLRPRHMFGLLSLIKECVFAMAYHVFFDCCICICSLSTRSPVSYFKQNFPAKLRSHKTPIIGNSVLLFPILYLVLSFVSLRPGGICLADYIRGFMSGGLMSWTSVFGSFGLGVVSGGLWLGGLYPGGFCSWGFSPGCICQSVCDRGFMSVGFCTGSLR